MSLLTRWPEFPLYNAICHTQQMFAQGSPPVFFLCIRIHIIQHKNIHTGYIGKIMKLLKVFLFKAKMIPSDHFSHKQPEVLLVPVGLHRKSLCHIRNGL